ncbi:MAG: hypothetical protein FWC36_05050 [Spirochaetes bacterium]|nr:hypothetical protein [Spirochaetota bacterium]
MLKKLSAIMLFCLISSLAFAQTAPRQILSEKDINNFIANYEQIMDAFELLEDKYGYLFDEIDGTGAELMVKLRSVVVPEEIQEILRKNGLGDNGFEKAMLIIQGIRLAYMEEYIKQIREAIRPLEDSIDSRDLALINSRRDELFELLQ